MITKVDYTFSIYIINLKCSESLFFINLMQNILGVVACRVFLMMCIMLFCDNACLLFYHVTYIVCSLSYR